MKLYFRPSVTVTCIILALLMVRASFWQWDRYVKKKTFIIELGERVKMTPLSEEQLMADKDIDSLQYRTALIKGRYDYKHELVLRNRSFEGEKGAYILTPLTLNSNGKSILVQRGFIPLSLASKEKRKQFQGTGDIELKGLIKKSSPRRFLAPADPYNQDNTFIDSVVRVDLEYIQNQIPYKIAPFYLEKMPKGDVAEKMISTDAGKEELFMVNARVAQGGEIMQPLKSYPAPVYDTVVPPGRHLGYVFEWAAMALGVLLIGLVLQLRRPKKY